MVRYDVEKRTFFVKKFFETKSIAKVQQAWRSKYKNQKAPDYSTIKAVVTKFEKTGHLNNLSRNHPLRTQKREAAKFTLKTFIEKDPSLSIRKLMQQAQISYSMTRSILKDDLKLKPYKTPTSHLMKSSDYPKRVDFATWFLKLSPKSHENIICTDEAWFSIKPDVNKQNQRVWASEPPLEPVEIPLHPQKIMVFCALSAKKIYGPYFFEGKINSLNYLDMLENWFWRKHLNTVDYKKYYFQQDGARPHTSNIVQEWLNDKFGRKFLSKEKWPPRSPDLNPCDFFLWGYLKSRVYCPMPSNIEELKANIEREIRSIPTQMLKSTFENFRKRLDLVISAEGKHIEIDL